jgi:peptide/nickel transport system substrate-binding protein
VKLALDRPKILQTVYRGFGTVTADIPEPPSDPYYPHGLGRAQNIGKAKQLLAAAGHPNGIDVELFTTDAEPHYVDLAIATANIVKAAGIRLKVSQQSSALYFSKSWMVKSMFVSNWQRRFPTEVLALLYTSTAANNQSRFKSPALDRLVAKARGTVNHQKQVQLVQQAFKIVANQDGTTIPVMIDLLALCSKKFGGVTLNSNIFMNLRNAHRV